jgi:two-component system, cell cycle sensor histidine kinase and response regulator CckA
MIQSMAVVLIVEDDEQVRVLADSVLQDAGHTVSAATGAEGATALLANEGQVDVLFVDLNLGNDLEAGLRLAKEAKSTRPDLAVLYTTGAAVNDGMKALFLQPYLFLPKPYTLEQLTQSVAFLLSTARRVPKPDWPSPSAE